jgi:hypothetical protein
MKVLVCGGRKFDREWAVFDALDGLHKTHHFTQLVHGGAAGADSLAGKWARKNNIDLTVVRANWLQYGRAAGALRNTEMLKHKPSLVVAFPGGTGTADMVRKSLRARISVARVEVLTHVEGDAVTRVTMEK